MSARFRRQHTIRTAVALMVVVVVMGSRRTVWSVVVIMLIEWRLMIEIRITTMLGFDTRGQRDPLNRQQTASEPGKNAEHQKPCRDSKHGAKKLHFP
ncbi:hypothetical protein ACFQY0_18555 [Haloferula chungangensis]|uniref:Secreted protein n=1 Tax=Haloferula chungangensis TaxID=1048331 RepID=A0ABW2L9V9_9BACT